MLDLGVLLGQVAPPTLTILPLLYEPLSTFTINMRQYLKIINDFLFSGDTKLEEQRKLSKAYLT